MLLDYFLKYVKIDTQSSETSTTSPSTKKQFNLSKVLLEDLKDLGILNAYVDEFGQVHAFIDGEKGLETIGLNAHIDTALEVTGTNVKPRIIENYDGLDIKLNDELTTKVQDFPILKDKKGKTLVVTDGNTLLGADDKAGLAIIMTLAKYLMENPHLKHHPLSILFTVDEEVGRGSEHFDNKIFKADYAYTVDGDSPYLVSYENFNAAHAEVKITGVSIHPGEAKGRMVNAQTLLFEFDSYLNRDEVPEKTELYEGFHHLNNISGNVELAEASYIIRDHSKVKLDEKIAQFYKAKELVLKNHPTATIDLDIGYDYKNMEEILSKDPRALRKIEKAYKDLNVEFKYDPIRGGTDGATFSFLGCPTPNIGTGSYNHHGRHEFFVLEEGLLLVEILKKVFIIQ